MHKIRLIIMTVILTIAVGAVPVYANLITDNPIISDDIVGYSIISDSLREELKDAKDDELIPVAIQFKDDINLEEVEKLALSRAELTEDETMLMNSDISGFSEEEQDVLWNKQMDSLRKVSRARIDILVDHYGSKNDKFIETIGIERERIGWVSMFTTFVREVKLTPTEIIRIALMKEVCYMDYDPDIPVEEMASVNDTYQIINGDVAVNSGYRGSGIKVGVVDAGHPYSSVMGSDYVNMNYTDYSTNYTPHATMICGIIKKMAHDCKIYTRTADILSDAIDDCEHLIKSYEVDVINLSIGACNQGKYDANSRLLDQLVKSTRVPIVVASGNAKINENSADKYMNQFALAPNVIAVGGVDSSGTEQSASGAYTLGTYSLYKENSGVINRPDICAPGNIQIYSYSDWGTSYATPHVTGTIVQMMSRNSNLKGNPEAVKAILMASASYDGGTSMTYAGNGTISNYEGAGVVDAGFCYKVASNYTHMGSSFDSYSTYISRDITVSSTSVPLRIACAWDVISTGDYETPGDTYVTDYHLYIYKNGVPVGTSTSLANTGTGARTNYEIIELSPSTLRTYGTGTYQIKITRNGSYYGTDLIRVGLAWGQR